MSLKKTYLKAVHCVIGRRICRIWVWILGCEWGAGGWWIDEKTGIDAGDDYIDYTTHHEFEMNMICDGLNVKIISSKYVMSYCIF